MSPGWSPTAANGRPRSPRPTPDLEPAAGGGEPGPGRLVTPGELRSLFTTRVRRQTRRLAAGVNGGAPSLIEAALDLGAIEADGRSQPIAEIELELIDGPPRALYDLALELDALTPLQVETRSKSVRGYTLAKGEPPAWQKAEPVELGAEGHGRRGVRQDPARLRPALVRERGRRPRWPRSGRRAPAAGGAAPPALGGIGVRSPDPARAAVVAGGRGEADSRQPRAGARLGRVR